VGYDLLANAQATIPKLSITPLSSSQILVSVLEPEHAADGALLGTLVEDLGWLEPFGLSGAKALE
jgi:hypothetical protein